MLGEDHTAQLGAVGNFVPRLVLDFSSVTDRLVELPTDPPLDPLIIGLCARRADLHRPLITALWNLSN